MATVVGIDPSKGTPPILTERKRFYCQARSFHRRPQMELGARELKLDPGRLRMMRVDRHKVHTLMRREEKVGDLQGSQWEYRIEVEPEEERPEVLKAARRTLVNVSHW